MRAAGAREVIFVGNSMGGFAALLFCAKLGFGRVVAFSPQTFICERMRRAAEDDRWEKQIQRLHHDLPAQPVFDLRAWIQSTKPEMRAEIYVSKRDKLDLHHAMALAAFPNITLHVFPDGGHELVAQLRDNGLLSEILKT